MTISFTSNGTTSQIIHNGTPVHDINAGGLQNLAVSNLATEAKPLGAGQTWQQFTVGTQRLVNTNYVNTTGRTIAVALISSGASAAHSLTIDGVATGTVSNNGQNQVLSSMHLVPNGVTYNVGSVVGSLTWRELR